MAKFTKSGGAGGRKGRSTRTRSEKSPSKSGWQRPDGRPLRARKGDFFPDEEIEKRKGRKSYAPRESGSGTPDSDSDRPRRTYGDRDEKKPFRTSRNEDSPRRSFGDRDERPRKSYGDRDEKKPFRTSRSEDTPRKSYGDRDERPRKSYGDRDEADRKGSFRKDDKAPKRFGMKEQREAGFKRMDRDVKHSGERQYRRPSGERGKTSSRQRSAGDGTSRLNKFIANTGLCSRREADELIEAGVITVNGEVVTELGTKVSQGDDVRYNGEPLKTERLVYVLLNKPKDFITTTDDPEERRTVMNLVADACQERIYPVGRLDRNTTGVLLLTNDGELTKKLTHPSFGMTKVYHVELDQNISAADMRKISEGVELEDGFVQVDEIAYASPDDKKQVGVELHSGRNRVVRRIFESLGYQVKKLDRTVFAGLTKKDLPRGRWRMLTELEVNALKMATGSKKQKG